MAIRVAPAGLSSSLARRNRLLNVQEFSELVGKQKHYKIKSYKFTIELEKQR